MHSQVALVNKKIAPVRAQLLAHPVYSKINNLEGETTNAIAKKLGIKANTVSTIKRMIFLKLGIHSEIALYKAMKEGN